MKLNILLETTRESGPIFRRFFINTLFDSTFMQIGIIMGSAFAANPDLRLIIGTLLSSSVALGISTGVSIYESETLERARRIMELEKAMFRKLDKTIITEKYRTFAVVLSAVNFFTPLLCFSIVVIPLLLATIQLLDITTASWISVVLALSIIFVAGAYLGRVGKQNPLMKGLRMMVFGIAAFAAGFMIQMLI